MAVLIPIVTITTHMPDLSIEAIIALPFFVRALAAGVMIAILAGSLGVLVVIRGMAFFADAIAHASLTGIALGVMLQLNPLWAALGFSVLVGLGIAWLSQAKTLKLDTIIGVSYSAAVALGVIIISRLEGVRVDLFGFLFGDILGISNNDLLLALGLTVVVLIAFGLLFTRITQIAVSRELAQVNGVRVKLIEFLFMALLAASVAIGIQLVGVILIGPLLIMPAAAAKNMSRSLVGMLLGSIVLGILGVVLGLFTSVLVDTPAGPTVVIVMALVFALSLLVGRLRAT